MLTALPSLAARPGLTLRPAPGARARASQGGLSVLPGVPSAALFGRVSGLTDGEELFPALLEAIDEARTSLKVDFHLLGGPEGAELAGHLARRAAQGLRVQVIAWGEPADATLRAALQTARSAGLTVRLGRGAGVASPVGKFLIADDRLAFVGALRAESTGARRGLLRLVGEAAAELGRQFNHDWAQAGGTPLPLSAPAPVARQEASGVSLVQVAGVGSERKAPRAVLLAALLRARRSLEVCVDVLTDADVVAALVAARRRGVAVRVVLPGDRRLVPGASRGLDAQAASLARLLEAGVEVRLCRSASKPQAVELRYAIVDAESLLFGSAPWSTEGFAAPGELLVEARGGSDWAGFAAAFAQDWTQAAPARAPHAGERLVSAAAPVFADLRRALSASAPRQGLSALWNWHVGVVRIGDRWKLVSDVR